METKSAAIHRKMPVPARQLPITGSAHKTRAVGAADQAAIGAVLDMPAQRRRPARLDRRHDATLGAAELGSVRLPERCAVVAEDIRHLQRGAHRAGSGRRGDQIACGVTCRLQDIQRADGSAHFAGGET